MKKIILVLSSILMISLGASQVVYAGTLNSYERDVISAAEGRFEYKGSEYKLDSAYIGKLTDYLSSDDVDLTADQRDAALQSMNGYVESGVEKGYLVPADGQKDTNSGSGSTNGSTSGTTQGNSGMNTADSKDGSDGASSSAQADSASTNTSDTKDFLSALFSSDTEASGSSGQNTDKTAGNTEAAASIIKDTGFDFNRTVITAAVMGVLMLAGIIVTIRSHYFAQENE